MPENIENTNKVVLITGAANRIGAAIANMLHAGGWRVLVHYHRSEIAAQRLVTLLNQKHPLSAAALQADLSEVHHYNHLVSLAVSQWGRLDALVNNAAEFFPTFIGEVTLAQWNRLFAVNLQAPFFLSQAAALYLRQHQGVIINITDTHADGRPIKHHSLYCMTKAGLLMQTQALARELAPDIRVNAVAPGVSLWKEGNELTPDQCDILARTPLKRCGNAEEVANAVRYLLVDAIYTTGSTIYVDGGRCVFN